MRGAVTEILRNMDEMNMWTLGYQEHANDTKVRYTLALVRRDEGWSLQVSVVRPDSNFEHIYAEKTALGMAETLSQFSNEWYKGDVLKFIGEFKYNGALVAP